MDSFYENLADLQRQMLKNQRRLAALERKNPDILAAVIAAVNGSIGGSVGFGK